MENEKDTTGMLPGINKSIVDIAYWGLIPEVYPWYSRVSWLWGDDMSGVMQLFGYTIDQVNRNRKLNEERKADTKYDTFLKKLLDLEAAHKITPNNTLDAAGSNIGAGSDTTAVSLSAVLYYLYRDARVLAKLREEMDTFAAEGKMSDPVTFAEAQSMPYLQAVLKESLRMHPAVGTILPRVVPRGGAKLGGYYFPEGVRWFCVFSLSLHGFLYIRKSKTNHNVLRLMLERTHGCFITTRTSTDQMPTNIDLNDGSSPRPLMITRNQ